MLAICLLWTGWQAGAGEMGQAEIVGLDPAGTAGDCPDRRGKITAALLLILFPILPALPLLVMVVYVWGIPWARLWQWLVFILTASWFFAALIFLAGHLVWLGVKEARILLGGGWLVISAAIPFLHQLNPLFSRRDSFCPDRR